MERTKILFVCIGNTCRSQMAEGFAHADTRGIFEIESAGTSAFGSVNRSSINSMAEIGIDITTQSSDQLTNEMLHRADVVITLGCCRAEDLSQVAYDAMKLDWPIPDPFGGPSNMMGRVRDDIGQRVKGLLDELDNSNK